MADLFPNGFIWTPFTTTVSVGCQHALIFLSFYRDFLRKILDLASPIVRDHYSLRVPKSYRQAMSSPQAEQWREAINKELSGLVALDTWDLVPIASIPATANIMHCHFVFAIKRKADGSIDKFKARLVADGNTQKHGVDFNRVFLRPSSKRLLFGSYLPSPPPAITI